MDGDLEYATASALAASLLAARLDGAESVLLAILLHGPCISAQQIAEKLGVGERTVRRRLEHLKDRGFLEWEAARWKKNLYSVRLPKWGDQ